MSTTIAERKQIWLALSNFYLEPQFDDKELKAFVQALKTSPYTLDEVMVIDRFEVWPVLKGYCFGKTKGREGFNEAVFISEAAKHLGKKRSFNFISSYFYDYFTGRYWARIYRLLTNNNQKNEY